MSGTELCATDWNGFNNNFNQPTFAKATAGKQKQKI